MENIKNNAVFKSFLMLAVVILLSTLVPVNVYATKAVENDALYIDGHKILTMYQGDPGNNGRMYADPGPFTFTSTWNGSTRYYDGKFMALEVSGTSTAGWIPIHIDLYVYNTHTHHDCTFLANGNLNKFDWISLGTTGGSASDNYYYVDSQNKGYSHTVDIKTYSWI